MTEYYVTIHLKAGGCFSFLCDELAVKLDYTGQRIKEVSWQNARPALLMLHLDNVAAIQATEVRDDGSDAQSVGWALASDSGWRGQTNEDHPTGGPPNQPQGRHTQEVSEARISLSPDFSENPWFKYSFLIQLSIWEQADAVVMHPEPKQCNRCHSKAWYSDSVKRYRCEKCLAIESVLDPGDFSHPISFRRRRK
jgi:hypothetical protein